MTKECQTCGQGPGLHLCLRSRVSSSACVLKVVNTFTSTGGGSEGIDNLEDRGGGSESIDNLEECDILDIHQTLYYYL